MKNRKCSLLSLFSLFSASALASYGQTTIAYSDVERINESGGSGNWFYSSGSDDALLAGNASSSNTIFETGLLFNISAFDAEIASASSISLNVAYSTVLGSGQDVTAYLIGTNASYFGSGGMEADTAHALATTGSSAGTILAGDFSAPGVASYDVTTIVQSQTGFDYVAVLLTSGITADTSGTAHDIQFYRKNTLGDQPNGGAYLTLVPEPQAFGLIAGSLGLVWVMLRRRR